MKRGYFAFVENVVFQWLKGIGSALQRRKIAQDVVAQVRAWEFDFSARDIYPIMVTKENLHFQLRFMARLGGRFMGQFKVKASVVRKKVTFDDPKKIVLIGYRERMKRRAAKGKEEIDVPPKLVSFK